MLTFAQGQWPSAFHQYKAGGALWSKLRKRVVREFGHVGYIQTWERFRKGGCHVNVLINSQKLLKYAESLPSPVSPAWWKNAARSVGFGWRCWVEPMRGKSDEMAGYLAKLAKELTGSGKEYQVPVDAPRHFRRLRASAKLLPPRRESDYTGRLVFAPLAAYLDRAGQSPAQQSEVLGRPT